ncbi:hypothetical protein [Paraburkholderia acidisoli]|uniref:Lipoprotein n=1 Tax=Paraburkholderia acidisoli TaxID=2571748 RepID=A0A7Z2GM05_9BURK|nr:hypothetical protein [Paraburkholderia acidisoli]QGZ63989.1 hypothetical protein FAZ98_19810 [Paraburkholderia acidisoli]
MRRSKLFLGAAAAAIVCASGAAHAAHVGVFIGGGVPYYYPVAPVPYYYGPPVIVAPPPPEPPEYIEQGQQAPAPAYQDQSQGQPYDQPDAQSSVPPGVAAGNDNGDTWYYCNASKTYYPYAKSCASGWRAVPAQAAPSN